MIEYPDIAAATAAARETPGVIAIEAGTPSRVYVQGDTLPAHMQPQQDSGIPQEVTMRQARLALLSAGKLEAANNAINALSEPQRTAALIEWEYSQTVQRHKGLTVAIGSALGMSDSQIDQLFITAATL